MTINAGWQRPTTAPIDGRAHHAGCADRDSHLNRYGNLIHDGHVNPGSRQLLPVYTIGNNRLPEKSVQRNFHYYL